MRKKYIVIDTWNGDGYSSENGVDTKQFAYKKSAFKWAYKRALSNADGDAKYVTRYSDEYAQIDKGAEGDGYFFDSYDDNCGSYQVWELKDAYAFVILCNVNDCAMLTKEQFEEQTKSLDDEYGEDLEENSHTEENGDKFYNSLVDDYDYQFRLISNLK
jgi:hypothetical protein